MLVDEDCKKDSGIIVDFRLFRLSFLEVGDLFLLDKESTLYGL